MTHYCYIIGAGPFVKIGYSSDPERRLRNLQTGNPLKCEIVSQMPFLTEMAARDMEKELHFQLRSEKAHGEWFHRKGGMKLLKRRAKMLRLPRKNTGRLKPLDNE